MSKQILFTKNAPKPIGPYSQAVKLDNGFVFVSGQIAIDPSSGEITGADVKLQTRRSIENIAAILDSCSLGLDSVVKTTVFLKDMNDFPSMNEVYSEFFSEAKPARSTIEVSRLPKDVRVEIEAVAFKSS